MRFFTPVLVSFFLIACATTESTTSTTTERVEPPEKDSLRVGVLLEPELWPELSFNSIGSFSKIKSGTWVSVSEAKKLSVDSDEGTVFYRVRADGQTGWLQHFLLSTPESYRNNRKWVDSLRERGHTLVPVSQSFEKNSAGGITVDFKVFNISKSRTVKYVRTTWRLFNQVGDQVAGTNSGSAEAKVRLTGPIGPMEEGNFEIENLWYSNTGRCAELRGLQVEHIDGTTFSTMDLKGLVRTGSQVKASGLALPDIDGDAHQDARNRINIRGDCSYESQQERREQ